MSDHLAKLLSPLRYACGASARAWRRRAKREHGLTVVLGYHRLVEGSGRRAAGYTVGEGVPLETFEAQMRFMLRHFEAVPASRSVLPDDGDHGLRFAVTFDDGYVDNLHLAAPILLRLGIPATFFVVSEYVGTRRRYWWDEIAWLVRHARREALQPAAFLSEPCRQGLPETLALDSERARLHTTACLEAVLRGATPAQVEQALSELRVHAETRATTDSDDAVLMDWNALRTLARQGFDIGSHSADHLNLAQLDADALARQLSDSKAHIEAQIGQPVRSLAYPYGGAEHFNAGVQAATRTAGYECAFTALEGPVTPRSDATALPRLGLNWPFAFACAHQLDRAMRASP
jgi:peptidoglycan/xylan/chitin deacetylase (PgdA/CDA1 family)